MTLRPQVVNLGGLNLSNDVDEVSTIAQITVVKMEFIGTYDRKG